MRNCLLLVLVSVSIPAAWGQSVLSAKSGTIHHVDGKASISGYDLKPTKTGEFPALEENQILNTEDAHAEVLLTPGVFLRLGEQSQLKMVSNKLTDTRVQLLAGSALVEVGEILPGNQIAVQVGDYRATLGKAGLYRFDSMPDRVRVFEGKVELASASEQFATMTVKAGRELVAGNAQTVKFDRKKADELYAWSAQRSALVARANISAARSAASSSAYRSNGSQWVFLPSFGLFTYLPMNGIWSSPFGYQYYSPRQVWVIYQPRYSNPGYSASNSGFGDGSMSRGGGGGGVPASAAGGSFGGAASSAAPARSGGGGGMPSGGARR